MNAEDEQVELSSESDPEDLDLDQLNDIRVDENDLAEIDRLISTTKQGLGRCGSMQRRER